MRWTVETDENNHVHTAKNNTTMIFTEGVDFSYLLTEAGLPANDPKMALRGVLEHDGAKNGGHYTNLHISVDQIYGTDNCRVSVGQTHQSKYAYMLLYVCRSSGVPYGAQPKGLTNPRRRNRCYFNAALQLLWCGPPLVNGLASTAGDIGTRDIDEQI